MRTCQQANLQLQAQDPCFEHGIMDRSAAADAQHSANINAQSEISQPYSALQSGCHASNCYCYWLLLLLLCFAQDT